MNIFRLASLATVLSILLVSAARADHRAPLPATIEERVCTLVADLDDVIADFQFTEGETPTFGDDRLNRALVRARQNVVTARMEISFGNLTRGFRSMRASVRELEKGAGVPVSGNGFADDLAVLLSGRAEFFTEDLLLMAAMLGAVSDERVHTAELDYLEGKALRFSGEWENATVLFGRAIHKLDKELVLGPLTCS